MTLYLGFDGAYVLSRHPLKMFTYPNAAPFLGTGPVAGCIKRTCIDIQPDEALEILNGLKLKPFEVVTLTVSKTRRKARKVSK